MAAMDSSDARSREREEHDDQVRWFHEFVHSKREDWEKRIETQLANNNFRITLDLNDIKDVSPGLDRRVLEQPLKYLTAWEEGLQKFFSEANAKVARQLTQKLRLDIRGPFGRNHVTPRGMTAVLLHQLVKVEGMVSKVSTAAPKLLHSIHTRKDKDDDGFMEIRDHRDQTSFVTSTAAGAMPTQDSEGNKLQVEVGLSIYRDTQRFTIQEVPEHTPAGQIPRSVEVVCDSDLVDKAKPGDRVEVIGVYNSFPPTAKKEVTNGVWPSRVIATSVRPVKDVLEQPFVPEDIRNIRDIAARPDTFELLSRSFAPSICGHEKVKAGLLLQMVGGTEKNLSNGTHLRGDINVLMVGDPSCGKSQMLRFVMNTAPLAISTTGRGSSGVGLTAAVTREPGSRDFTLEAGAMVLADRGVICIDEFDKMSQNDRVAIHEAMEQQCVTIAKAGMHVTLNARCSVVAAANPIYSSFDPNMDLAKNIGLPDSLLSRFDLIYIVRDLTTEELDRRIATQVLQQAMLRLGNADSRRGVEQVHSSILERQKEATAQQVEKATEVFQEMPAGLDGSAPPEVVTVDFLRKYVRYCKRLSPMLTEAAQAIVAEKYVDMRTRFQSGFLETVDERAKKKPRLAVTTRTLEALIRLATAHAKLKLRMDEVTEEDVEEAYRLMLSAREEDVPARVPQAAPEPEPESVPLDSVASSQLSMSAGSAVAASAGRKRPREEVRGITAQRLKSLQTLVARAFAQQKVSSLSRVALRDLTNAGLAEGEQPFDEEEFTAGLERMEEINKVMLEEATGDVMNVA